MNELQLLQHITFANLYADGTILHGGDSRDEANKRHRSEYGRRIAILRVRPR